MSVAYQVDQNEIKEISAKLSKFGKAITNKNILSLLAVRIKDGIRLRTLSGKDIDGNAFAKYSAKYKAKEGKTAVNLMLTGNMLNSMTQKVISNDTVQIFFTNKDARNKALGHMEGANNLPAREFFGVSSEGRKKALKTYAEEVAKQRKAVGL